MTPPTAPSTPLSSSWHKKAAAVVTETATELEALELLVPTATSWWTPPWRCCPPVTASSSAASTAKQWSLFLLSTLHQPWQVHQLPSAALAAEAEAAAVAASAAETVHCRGISPWLRCHHFYHHLWLPMGAAVWVQALAITTTTSTTSSTSHKHFASLHNTTTTTTQCPAQLTDLSTSTINGQPATVSY